MPMLIRFLITNFAIGAAIGLAVGGAFVWSNASGMGDLLAASHSPIVAAALVGLSFASTFGLGYLSTALLLLSSAD